MLFNLLLFVFLNDVDFPRLTVRVPEASVDVVGFFDTTGVLGGAVNNKIEYRKLQKTKRTRRSW